MTHKSPAPRSGRLKPNPNFFSPNRDGQEDNVSEAILKQARKTGHLNLSNRSLSSVPSKVWRLNIDPPEGSSTDFTSDERWWDQVELKRLNLSANQISELSDELKNFPALQSLDVQYNKLVTLPSAIGSVQNLSELLLSHNQLTSIPNEIQNLSCLQVLRLDSNQLSELPDSITHVTSLETLNVSQNVLTSLPFDIGILRNLKSLNVSENRLTALPESLGNLTGLRELILTKNKLTSIPTLNGFEHLEELTVRHNKLTEFPSLVNTRLKSLLLGFNSISLLPEERLRSVTTLTILELRDNRISKLPDCITELVKLERLDLSNNDLSSLPYVMGRMEFLQSLHLDGNGLKTIRREIINRGTTEVLKYLRGRIADDIIETPPTLSMPSQLNKIRSLSSCQTASPSTVNSKELNLSKCDLTAISDDDITAHTQCSKLNASFNKLTVVPDTIGVMTRLTVLDLSNNQLKHLPPSLVSCVVLQDVIISENRFSSLPDVLYSMPSLENILAGNNRITVINVDELMKMKSLACLDLHNNDIQQVPPQLGRMEWLRHLDISGNAFRNPRPTIVAKGTVELLQYLRDRIPT